MTTGTTILAACATRRSLVTPLSYRVLRGGLCDGVDVIVPGEMPLNVLLASKGVTHVDDVPIIDGLAVTLKLTEAFVDLRRTVGLKQSRHGWMSAAPDRARVHEVLAFYGLGKLLEG